MRFGHLFVFVAFSSAILSHRSYHLSDMGLPALLKTALESFLTSSAVDSSQGSQPSTSELRKEHDLADDGLDLLFLTTSLFSNISYLQSALKHSREDTIHSDGSSIHSPPQLQASGPSHSADKTDSGTSFLLKRLRTSVEGVLAESSAQPRDPLVDQRLATLLRCERMHVSHQSDRLNFSIQVRRKECHIPHYLLFETHMDPHDRSMADALESPEPSEAEGPSVADSKVARSCMAPGLEDLAKCISAPNINQVQTV